MKKIIYTLGILLISLLFSLSCSNQKSKKTAFLPTVKGKAGEVIVVLNKDKWNGEIGLSIKQVLMGAEFGLPQPEPLFDLVNINHSAFSGIFKSHRNIVLIKVSKSIKEAKLVVQRDAWAKPQIFMKLLAPNYTSLNNLITENKTKLVALLKDAERKRLLENYRKYEEKSIREFLTKEHNISLIVPTGYKIDVEKEDFVWLAQETPRISQGVLVYFYDYTYKNTFTPEYLVKKRDQFLKKYVPGPAPESYMSTEKEFFPIMNEFMLDEDRYIAELRGMWKVENDFMGGAFLSYTTLDEKRNRIVTVDGFVYAPQSEKRNYLRQLEAILYTLKITE